MCACRCWDGDCLDYPASICHGPVLLAEQQLLDLYLYLLEGLL